MLQGARVYAMADRSDPFAFDRAMTHVSLGIADVGFSANNDPSDRFYQAEQIVEERTLHGGVTFSDGSKKFSVLGFRNMKRP